jgi:hypothetical protein
MSKANKAAAIQLLHVLQAEDVYAWPLLLHRTPGLHAYDQPWPDCCLCAVDNWPEYDKWQIDVVHRVAAAAASQAVVLCTPATGLLALPSPARSAHLPAQQPACRQQHSRHPQHGSRLLCLADKLA